MLHHQMAFLGVYSQILQKVYLKSVESANIQASKDIVWFNTANIPMNQQLTPTPLQYRDKHNNLLLQRRLPIKLT